MNWSMFYLFLAIWHKSYYGPSIRSTIDTAKINELTCVLLEYQVFNKLFCDRTTFFSFSYILYPFYTHYVPFCELLSFILDMVSIEMIWYRNPLLWKICTAIFCTQIRSFQYSEWHFRYSFICYLIDSLLLIAFLKNYSNTIYFVSVAVYQIFTCAVTIINNYALVRSVVASFCSLLYHQTHKKTYKRLLVHWEAK